MEKTSDYLFVYGTLLDGQNEFAIYLKQNCSFYGEGKFEGKLYDLGEYPGAVLNDGNDYVQGSIFELKNAEEVLTRLDDYEGVGKDQEQPNLFVRERVSVKTKKDKLDCWVYLYNLPVDGFRLIELGDYIGYKNF